MKSLLPDLPDKDLLPLLKPTDRLYWLLVETEYHIGMAESKSKEFAKEMEKIAKEKENETL